MNLFESNRSLGGIGATRSGGFASRSRSWLIGILAGGVLSGVLALPAHAATAPADNPWAPPARDLPDRPAHHVRHHQAAPKGTAPKAKVAQRGARHHHVATKGPHRSGAPVRHKRRAGGGSAAHDATALQMGQLGVASWYGGRRDSRRTASGVRLDDSHLTAAHPFLPMHSRVRVTNLENGRSVTVQVTDRGPHLKGRIIDLSPSAAEQLDMVQAGLARVRVEPIASLPPDQHDN